MSSERKVTVLRDFRSLCLVLLVASGVTFAGQTAKRDVATDVVSQINRHARWNDRSTEVVDDDILIPRRPVTSGSSQGYSAASRRKSTLWPGGVIPYKLDASITRRPNHLRMLKAAMAEWERLTCVRFVDKKNETVREYVNIYYGRGCRGSVGRWRNTNSILSLGYRCDHFKVMLHELGHTIGYWHEQSRPDRDQYVTILWNNIPKKWHFAFERYSRRMVDSRDVPYDYHSIMHYGKTTYSKNGKITIKPRDPSITSLGNSGLSRLDVKQTNILYKCNDFPKFPEDFFFVKGHLTSSPHCIGITEPRDPTWLPTSMCYQEDAKTIALKWSHRGPVPNMNCTNTVMPDRRQYSRFWRDNYLCVPPNSMLQFTWSVSGPIAGMQCLRAPGSGLLYHLCAVRRDKKKKNMDNRSNYSKWSPWRPCSKDCGGGRQVRLRTCRPGRLCVKPTQETCMCNMQKCLDWPHWPDDFRYHIGPLSPSESCTRIYERSQYSDWLNHMICWRLSARRKLSLQWSDSGPTDPGMRCTHITEPLEPRVSGSWDDNYLCVNNKTPYKFRWSYNGVINGLECLKWRGNRVAYGWSNNYLCAERYPKPSACPSGWKVYRTKSTTHCYQRVDKTLSWHEARRTCRQRFNSDLLSVASVDEIKFVKTSVQKGHYVWIGMNDVSREGIWQWSNRSPVTVTNWEGNEPNDGGFRHNEDCAMMLGYNSQWNDYPCSTRFRFICKKSVTPLK